MPKPTNMITPAPNVVKPGVQTNNSQPKTATVSTPSAYQQNLQQPLKQDKWYAGDYPTSREMLGKIYSIYQEDREYGQKMLDNFHAEQQNSSSRYYNPYSATTNRAVQNLANLGVDASQINDEWYKQNPGWQNYLKFNGTTNTPSSPGKRASVQEKIAFEIYQLGKADEDTKKMKSEWDAMKDELSYWANRSDLNLSDDEIVDRVTKEMQSKYPTLARMQESTAPGKALLELNEGSDFSVDNMYGTIWAARNGGGVGSAEANTMLSALGNGNVWNDNPQIRGKLNRNDKNTYSPYSVGMTLNDAGLYFGVSSFDDESLEQIRKGIDWNDQTAVRYYNDAVAANETTKKAEAELANLKDKVNGWLKANRSAEWIQKKINTYMEDGEWPTLRDMDKSIATGGKVVDTTRKIDYRRQDFDTYVNLQTGIRDSKMTGGETTNSIKSGIAADTSRSGVRMEADRIDWANREREATAQGRGEITPLPNEVPGEMQTENAIYTHEDFEKEEAGRRAAYDGKYGEGAYDAAIAAEEAALTESDIAKGKATDKKINDAGGVVDASATEDEKVVWAKSGSSFYDGTKLFFQDAKDNMQSVVIGMAGNAEKAVTQNYFETSLDTVYDIYAYEAKSAQLAEDKNAFAELKAKYGDVSLLQKEFRPSFTATVNDDAGNEVNVSLEWSDAKQEYIVKDISAPDRGIYGMDDDIFVHMYEAGSEANELMRVAHNVANEQSEEARQIRKAQDAILAGGEEAANEVEQYKRLSAAIQRGEAELSAGEQKYNEQKQSFEDSMKNLEIINSALEDLGMDTVNISEAQAMLDYMSQFYDEPALPMSDETAYQWVNKLAQYSGGEATQDMAKAKLRDYMGNIDSEIDTLEMAIAYIEDKGFTVPDRVRRNMEFKLEDLQNKKKDIEYSMLLTETPSEEMDKAVEAGKAFEEKYGEKAMYQWNEIFTDPEENVEDKYSTLKNKQRFDLYDQLTYQEKNEDGTVSEKKFELITPDEEKLYYYLLGKGVEKYGEEFAELWNVEQYNAEQFQRMKNLIADIFAESNDFVSHMSDDNYGVWTTREADYSGKWAQGEVDRGGLSGTIANIGATLSTPLESVSSAYYMIDRAISGKRFNADTKYGRISDTKEGIRAATFQSIKDTYGEGSIQEKLASLGYEIYANRGDSLMNSLAFGSIFHFEGKFGEILSSFGGSTPMGATAAMSAAAKAVENGANLDQVWLIAGATFLSETMTEAITMSNIKDALGTAEELSGDTLKDIIKDWLTKDGLEEALGESINDIAENAADRWAAMMNNSNYQDEFGQLVEKYLAEGYENDQAEEMALEEQAKGVLHTAFVSYLSAGSEALMATGKAAMNGTNYYRAVTKARQQSGYNESTLGNMVRSFRTRNGKANITAEAKATEHMMDENMSEKLQPRKATPEQKEAATDIVTIEQAKNSDESTKSAALSSVLTTNTKKGRSDFKADAAAAFASNAFGDNAESVIQETLHGAAEAGLEIKSVKNAIKNAALGDGAATKLVQSDYFKNAKPAEKARLLVQTLQQDSFDKVVNGKINSKINEFRKTRIITQLAGQGHFDQAQTDRAAAEKAAETTQRVQQDLDTQRNVESAAAEETSRATENLNNEPTADNLKALTHAVTKQENMQKVTQEYEQSVKKAQQDQQSAEAKADQSANDAMNQARAIADEQIAQEDQRIADEDEQERIAQEQAEQEAANLQAEEDRLSGKAEEDRQNAAIEQAVANENLEADQAEERTEALKERRDAVVERNVDLNGKVTNAEGMLAIHAFERKTGISIRFADMPENVRGKYQNGVVYLNQNRVKSGKMLVGQALVEASLHEITHAMENTNSYQNYRNVVAGIMFGDSNANYDNNAKLRAAIDTKISEYRNSVGQELTREQAEQEIIADFARLNLANKDTIQRFMDAGMGGKMRNILHNINEALKNFFGRLTGEDRQIAENLRKAERAFQKALNEVAKTATHPEAEQFSVMQFAQSAGLTFNDQTLQLFDKDGNEIDGVKNKVTTEMINKTPVGMLIDSGLTGKQNADAKEMMVGLMNMVARYKDSNLVWEIGATTLSSTFSALKSNSDPQYKTTVDFGTVCAKTQAIIDTMSQVMLDRVKAGKNGGLTRKDIMKVYNAVNKAGLSVPCPVCYVFSRWMGVPSLLGQMSQYQHDFVVTGKDGKIDKAATQKKVDAYLKNAQDTYGDAKAINNQKTKLQNKRSALEEKRVELDVQSRDTKLTKEQRKEIKQQLDDVLDQMVDLDKQIGEVSAYNWITQALCKKDKSTGKFVIDDKFRVTPDEVLFDLNRTGEFAKDEKNWKYRNTRGAGMGKAIMPYSGETIGDILYGVKAQGRQIKNPWLNMDEKKAVRQLKDAQKRAKQQNLVGGQRLQSTSDFRPEWGLDYIMSFLELQAAKSKVQMYTKVAEAVDFFASVGADVNLSIMGKGTGWHEATAEELASMTEEQKEQATVNGKVYVMDFSDVTGMKYGTARDLKNKYDNVQMILVGMNDTHIRLALKNSDIDFVIPWHSSGNSKDVLAGLIKSVGEKLDSSVDYTTTQTDMVKGTSKKYTDENGNKLEYTAPGERTEEQKALWDARVKLLTKGDKELTQADREVLLSNPITKELYRRFTEQGYDDECFGVKLTKDQANQIFPYEYWDTSSTKETADINGQRFVEYCEAMGIVPRFSQFKDDPGYWKLLIDRPMYNNDGSYHQQQTIDVTNAKIGNLNEEGQLTDSDIPTKAQAKYAPKDPRSENYNEYTEAQKNAIEYAEAALDAKYDDGTEGQYSVYGNDMTEADMELLDDEGTEYEGRYSTEGEMTDADRDIDRVLVESGVLTQEQINKMNKTDVGEGTRQWGTHMAQDMDELAEQAREYVLKHSAYQQDTNKEQIERAVEWFKKRTERLQKKYEESGETKDKAAIMSEVYTSALQQITDKKFNFRSADGQARMAVMMGMAIARDDTYGQVQIANQVNRQGTALGQALQSRKLFRLMTPQGRIATLTKMLDEQQQELYAKGKNVELKFSDWLIRAAGAAENEGEMDLVRAAAINELAEQIPANFADRVRNLRMLSMLANPRTHIRNIIGNAFFAPFVSLKNKFGAFGEIITKQEERTKTLAIASPKDVRAFAREQANTIRDVLTGEAKFTEATQLKKAQGKLGAFMDGLSDVNSRFLEGEDWFFLKGHFRRAFGGWMTANGYTVEQVKNDASLLAKGRQYAVDEAQKATYRDFNEAAAKLNALSRDSETIWGKGLGFVTDAVLPFKKTPANILRRGLEYSPLGIVKGLSSDMVQLHRYNQALQDLESGKITEMPKNVKSPNQVIDDICSGLSGSMIMCLGFLLAGSGAVTCGMDDDEDKFEKAKGRQKYSIKLFDMDVTYTMDWAAPMSMPFFVGAAIRDEVDNGSFDFEKAFNAVTSISEPIFNLSMLDGLNTVFKTSQYDDTNELTQIGAKILSNYLSSYVPSALGAVNRALVDDKSRKAFVKSGEGTGVAGTFRYAWEQFENKIPGLSQTNIPVRDIWGRIKTEDLARRIAENFISPGYIEDYNNDPIINEMARLYTVTNNPDMIPKEDPEKSFSSKNVKYVYDAEQWDKLKEVRNGTAFEMLTELINSDSYKDDTTTDAARAEMISRVWNYANQVGRKAVFPEYQMDNLGEDAIGTIANESKVSVYQTDMLHYLDDGDLTSYNNMVEAIRFEMGDDKTADAKIKEKIGNSYRDKYKAAYRKNDDDEMDRIKNILDDSGFSFKISDWEKAVDKEE